MAHQSSFQRRFAVIIGLSGVVLMGYMILFEDEPGAVPMVMIIGGWLWYRLLAHRDRNRNRSFPGD